MDFKTAILVLILIVSLVLIIPMVLNAILNSEKQLFDEIKNFLKQQNKMFKDTCLIGKDPLGYEYFQCLECGKRSYNPDDIKNYYCGNCHKTIRTIITTRTI